MPAFSVSVVGDRLDRIKVLRGAPCGATWAAAERVAGLPAEEAAVRIGLEVQYFCFEYRFSFCGLSFLPAFSASPPEYGAADSELHFLCVVGS